MWNVVITLATVGFGDLYAVTWFGRAVAIMITFWGLIVSSLTVVIVLEQLAHSHRQAKSHKLLTKLITKSNLKDKAVEVLQKATFYK